MKTLASSDMLCFSLYAAGQAMQQAYKPLLAPLGLTYPQYLVMSALWTEDGQTVGTLGRTLGLASNTLTPLLKRAASSPARAWRKTSGRCGSHSRRRAMHSPTRPPRSRPAFSRNRL